MHSESHIQKYCHRKRGKIEKKENKLKNIYHNISYKNNAHHRLSLIKANDCNINYTAIQRHCNKGEEIKNLIEHFFFAFRISEHAQRFLSPALAPN